VSFVRKSIRIHEFPLAQILLDQLSEGESKDQPLFPELYANSEKKLKDKITKPRLFMQALLDEADPPRPRATLHSFRVTFNNELFKLGLGIEDRQVLLAHSASQTTKRYTHPNFDKASKTINQLPNYTSSEKN